MLYQATIASPLGNILIEGSEKGVTSISFNVSSEITESNLIPECLKDCAIQLKEYFDGFRKEFDLKLDFADAPSFHQEVWKMVRLIPYGRTRSYADIAEILDHNYAFRAVGRANGMNPLPIVIPCHRVVGKDGNLTGYAYGLEMKRWLLAHESPGQYMKQADLEDALAN